MRYSVTIISLVLSAALTSQAAPIFGDWLIHPGRCLKDEDCRQGCQYPPCNPCSFTSLNIKQLVASAPTSQHAGSTSQMQQSLKSWRVIACLIPFPTNDVQSSAGS